MATTKDDTSTVLLCSDCFVDEGLRTDAYKQGLDKDGECPKCRSPNGRKLTKDHIEALAWRFFVSGTTVRSNYGGAPIIQFNEHHYGKGDISPSPWLKEDIKLIEDAAHSVHPLAGQGLNLGLEDAAVLTETIRAREYWRGVGDLKLLRRYERARRADVQRTALTMHGLQQLFAQAGTGWQSLRNVGMNGFDHSGVIKQWVARQAMGI